MTSVDDVTIRLVEIADRIGMPETNIVTERTARLDAELHVQTLTALLQTFTRNPSPRLLSSSLLPMRKLSRQG